MSDDSNFTWAMTPDGRRLHRVDVQTNRSACGLTRNGWQLSITSNILEKDRCSSCAKSIRLEEKRHVKVDT